jgi:hypothetical protein
MPWPVGDVDRSYERQTFDFLTGSGLHSVSTLSTGSRTHDLAWEVLHADTFARIEQFRIGANGPGPWAYIDPAAPNLLPPNVAAATGLYADASQMTVSSGSLLSNSDPTQIHRATGYRSIRWYFPTAAATTPILDVPPLYRSWFGHPVAPSLPYTFSSWAKPDGTVDTSVTVNLVIEWLTITGSSISTTASGTTAVTTWQQLSASGTAPSNAAYAKIRWEITGSTMTTLGSLYIDEPLWEQDSVVNSWAPGTGIRPVEIVDLPETVPFAARFRTGTKMSLRELAK